ncbi:MAG: preprotein translocase subunit SecG [Bauldia sp.]|nr:preprotein translocase subunit SecG [Bauldia sp.]
METVLLVIHLMIVTALVGLVLVQRSEGGALGIGGGGNFMASRGSGNVLTRTTTYLAIGFFITSIALTLLARANLDPSSVLDGLLADPVAADGVERPATGNLLDLIRPATTVPTDDAGAAAVPAAGADTPAVPNEGAAPAALDAAPAVPNDAATPAVPAEGAAPAATPAETPATPAATPVVPP